MLLHDRTRRKLTIGIFLACCVAPTVWVGAWCVRRHLPEIASSEAQRFTQQLGLGIRVDAVRFVRPNSTEYRGVVVVHPETGRPVLRCQSLRTERGKSAQNGRSYVLLMPEGLRVEAEGASEVVALLVRVLQGRGGWDGSDVILQAARVDWDGQPAEITPWTEVSGRLLAVSGGAQWEIAMRLPGDRSSELPRVRVWRNRQSEPARTGLEVQTGKAALPVRLAALLVPDLDVLGSQARFSGRFWASEGAEGWEGEGSGRLDGVDLDLLTRPMGERLTGLAIIQCDQVRVRRGRIDEASGSIVAREGTVGRGFVELAQREGGMLPGNLPPGTETEWPYEELAMHWSIAADGFTLRGQCQTPATGAILGDRYGPLLRDPLEQPQLLANLIRFLCPPTSAATAEMPATPRAAVLRRCLP